MARRKDSLQKAAMREMMRDYLKNNDISIKDSKTNMIERLLVGKYTLREESAPYGYKMASDVTFEVKETAEIQKVSMKDEQAVGKIVIEKTDKITGKPIEGVVFEVRDKNGKVLDTLTTDKNGHAESREAPYLYLQRGWNF